MELPRMAHIAAGLLVEDEHELPGEKAYEGHRLPHDGAVGAELRFDQLGKLLERLKGLAETQELRNRRHDHRAPPAQTDGATALAGNDQVKGDRAGAEPGELVEAGCLPDRVVVALTDNIRNLGL